MTGHPDAGVKVVMYSGGISSWAAAKRATGRGGEVVLLFADTRMEDPDVYRFINESAAQLGCDLVTVADGRDPWEVFFDVRFLGNSRVDPCSRILKRDLLRRWLEDHCAPAETEVVLGFDWTEPHRIERAATYWDPWTVVSPLADPPYLDKHQLIDLARQEGLEPPSMYAAGFAHANCGGFCIKAGQGHFATLLAWDRDRYLYHEEKEQAIREHLGKDVAILTDRSGGNGGADRRPMTLRKFRERIEDGWQCDMFDIGGCACFDAAEV